MNSTMYLRVKTHMNFTWLICRGFVFFWNWAWCARSNGRTHLWAESQLGLERLAWDSEGSPFKEPPLEREAFIERHRPIWIAPIQLKHRMSRIYFGEDKDRQLSRLTVELRPSLEILNLLCKRSLFCWQVRLVWKSLTFWQERKWTSVVGLRL